MISPIARLRASWSNLRTRIVISALLLGAIFGIFDVTLPLDDLYVSARAQLREEKADGSIIVVKLDDPTLQAIHDTDTNPGRDAKLITRLMEAGAAGVYFDRTYPFSARAVGGQELVTVLARYPGRVHFGVTARPGSRSRVLDVLPAPEFQKNASLVSIMVAHHPLNLSFSFPMASRTVRGSVPSLAASLAGVSGDEDGMFRADFAVDPNTIPSVSYIDVLEGRLPSQDIAGRKFVIGWTSSTQEVKPLPLGEFMPAVYFHVIAAQTLKNGPPINLGWLPSFLAVAILIVTGVGRGRSFKPMRLVSYAAVLIGFPFLLDHFHIEYAVMPSAVMAIYATFRARTLDKMKDMSETNATSGLPSLQALRGFEGPSTGLMVALKMRNYAGIIRSFQQSIEPDLAHELQRRIRLSEPDVTVYHEGDMFVWISNLGDIVDVFENLEGLHRIVQNGIVIEGTEVDVGFNCGVDSDTLMPLPQRLANAMQSAEEAVRSDELVCHHDGEKGEVQWEISLLASLDRAIDNGEVWVAFQPKLDVATGAIVGAEALARWSHPERGPISPDKFIGIAEEYHRIERITRFVLDRAIRAAKSIVSQGRDFTVSVNISAQLLRNPRLPRMISEALTAHDLAPAHLILEITETDRLDRSAKTVQMMKELVAAGLTISIDDFGTGNATIDYLRYLPAAEVKIDKVFIRDIESNPEDQLLVQSIIEMAHSLGRRVVAEGVETADSLELLTRLNCDLIQGYYVGRPVPIRDFREALSRKSTQSTG